MRVLGFLFGCAILSGCSTVDPDHRVTGHYLGYVRVLGPASQQTGVEVEDVTAIGGWIDSGVSGRGPAGIGVGFRRLERAISAGDRCGLTILVTDETQLEAVEALVKTYAEGQACVILNPTSH